MALNWNEIRTRALSFANEWKDETSEDAEAKSFWDQFFTVFGIPRRRVASFEHKVPLPNKHLGYIDVFWKGVILVEHKSRGKNLDKALTQAKDYFPGLKDEDLPRYILVSDFERFRLYDLEEDQHHEFNLQELPKNIHLFDFLLGYEKRKYREQDPVNLEAALRMGKLHDQLKAAGYEGHELELFLVRLLFCLFADDTGIFERQSFLDLIERKTKPDGSDLGLWLAQLFDVLDKPEDKRQKTLDEDLQAFPYVNGKLFSERLSLASFDSSMRSTLLHCCNLDWGKISPAIFGSLFQSVMNPKERRNLGAHYTSEKNILKLIKPLFLDELWQEFEAVKKNETKLRHFHKKLGELRFLDPACGCGNFLIITYRELRLLEIEVLKVLHKGQLGLSLEELIWVDVDQFYGIEYEEFPSQIAQVAMWLIDHQMNQRISTTFGEYFMRLPLRKSATILNGNALKVEWRSLLPLTEPETVYDYIIGNPPFIGKSNQNSDQKKDLMRIFSGVKNAGVLDYVAAWYLLAAQYMQEKGTKTAFVSTSSINQGEQVSVLWGELILKYQIKIHFAHRTFSWSNEAKSNAAVHVVIIGFAAYDTTHKYIFDYENVTGEPSQIEVKKINPYLLEGPDIFLTSKTTPICQVPPMVWGNKPVDGGNLIIDQKDYEDFTKSEPLAKKFIKRFIGGQEFIYNQSRYCLWLLNATPSELRSMPLVLDRIDRVKKSRLASVDPGARKLADKPALFRDTKTYESYIGIPEVSSEKRDYIPIGFLNSEVIPSNKLQVVENASLYHFGILTSQMHMSWVRYVCGRLESRFSYSGTIVYNNFPWPEAPSEKQIKAVEAAAKAVLDTRAQFPSSSLADLYDPLTMPPALLKAHQQLDKAVDLCYRPQPFPSETKRIEYLFELYEKYTAGLFAAEKKPRSKKEKVL